MKKPLNVCSVSFRYAERSIAEDLARAVDSVAQARALGADMVCLPELTPYVGVPIEDALENADAIPGDISDTFCRAAEKHRIWITVGMFEKSGDHYFNSCPLISSAGQVKAVYHKMFPTLGELEHKVRPGDAGLTIDTPWGRVGFATCFDLNFSEAMGALVPYFITFTTMLLSCGLPTVCR